MSPSGTDTTQMIAQAHFGRYLTSWRARSTRQYTTKTTATTMIGANAAHGMSRFIFDDVSPDRVSRKSEVGRSSGRLS